MKISNCVVGGALLLSGLCSARAVWAQTADLVPLTPLTEKPAAKVGTTEKKTYQLRLRNIRPSLMAFWLDPQNHQLPSDLGPAPASEAEARAATRTPKKGVFVLPEGVDRIVAVDPQHALLVFGTPEGVAKLQETIAFLDRPLRQVEIEAMFVSVKAEDVSAFGIDFTTARGNNTNAAGMQPRAATTPAIQLGFVRGNFQAALVALEQAGRAKVISAPRVTAVDNLPAQISQGSLMPTPTFLGTQDESGELHQLLVGTGAGQYPIMLSVGTVRQLLMTPTINSDNTVTISLSSFNELQLEPFGTKPMILKTDKLFDTVVTTRDGETIALGGIDSRSPEAFSATTAAKKPVPALGQVPATSGLSTNKPRPTSELMVFITARIVRRAGEPVGQ